MTTTDIFRIKDGAGVVKTPVTKITSGVGISISRLKDASGTFELDEVIIENTGSFELDEDVYDLLNALNSEVL
jgi:hypothetical protein